MDHIGVPRRGWMLVVGKVTCQHGRAVHGLRHSHELTTGVLVGLPLRGMARGMVARHWLITTCVFMRHLPHGLQRRPCRAGPCSEQCEHQ